MHSTRPTRRHNCSPSPLFSRASDQWLDFTTRVWILIAEVDEGGKDKAWVIVNANIRGFFFFFFGKVFFSLKKLRLRFNHTFKKYEIQLFFLFPTTYQHDTIIHLYLNGIQLSNLWSSPLLVSYLPQGWNQLIDDNLDSTDRSVGTLEFLKGLI